MIAAIILAAGKSQRLGYPKALLSLGSETFAARLCRLAGEAGVDRLRVVLGYRAKDLRRLLGLPDDLVVVNNHHEEGQLSSLQRGLQDLEADAVLVMPVDHPLITVHLLRQMVDCFRLHQPHGVIPTFKGRGGHPALFSRDLFPELLNCPPEDGARPVLNRHRDAIYRMPTREAAVILDVDTADDYRRVLQFHCAEWKQALPSACEGEQPEPVVIPSDYCPRCSNLLPLHPAEAVVKSQWTCATCGYILT